MGCRELGRMSGREEVGYRDSSDYILKNIYYSEQVLRGARSALKAYFFKGIKQTDITDGWTDNKIQRDIFLRTSYKLGY